MGATDSNHIPLFIYFLLLRSWIYKIMNVPIILFTSFLFDLPTFSIPLQSPGFICYF